MTSVRVVYEAFLAKLLEDEWLQWTEEEMEADMFSILLGAIPWFKFPRVSLEIEGDNFKEDLSNNEVQILATYMKCEWLNRTIMSWDNVRFLYDERDYSPANWLDKIKDLLNREEYKAEKLERVYYRSRKFKPFDYTKLAGKNG